MIKQAIRVLVLTSVFASGIASALMIDQVTGVGEPFSGVNNLSGKLQGFTPTQNNVAGGGFYFSSLYKDQAGMVVPVTMTIAVWNGLPGTGSVIASGTAFLSNTGWLDAFWSPVSIVPNTSYYLALTTSGVPLNSNQTGPANGGTEPVVNGGFFGYSGGLPYQYNPTNPPPNGSLQGPYDWDWSFRTYYADTVAPVPLPAAAWLLLSGLGGLGFMARRRKAA